MDVKGIVKEIFDLQKFDSGFYKQEFVVTTQEDYPQHLKFECIKEKTEMLQNLKPGDEVTVHFNLRGNEYNGRYYVNLQAWRIEKGNSTPTAETDSTDTFDRPPLPTDEPDDLPF